MGLSSLPVLNKLGYNNYWTNFNYSNKLQIEEFSNILTIEILILILSGERFFYNYYNRIYSNKNYKSYMINKKNIIFDKKKIKTYTGEFWFFIYSNYFLISTLVYNSNVANEKSIKLRVNYNILSLFYLNYINIF